MVEVISMANSRRANGEGTISRRSDGRWMGRISLQTADGRSIRKSVYSDTQKGVRALLDDLALQSGKYTDTGDKTVASLCKLFLDDVTANLAPKTAEQHRYAIDGYINPVIGMVKLSALKPAHIDKVINGGRTEGRAGKPLAPATLRMIRRTMNAIFNRGIEWGLLSNNPVAKSRQIKVEAKAIDPMTTDRAKALYEAFLDCPTVYPLALCLTTGMRIGECLGLTHSSIKQTDSGMIIAVRSQMQRVKGEWKLSPLKTLLSRRNIPITDAAAEVIRRQTTLQKQLRSGGDMGLLFTTSGGKPVDPNNLRRWCREALPRRGLAPVTPHELRHGFGSLLIGTAGVDIKTTSILMGHSSPSLTLSTYTHIADQGRIDAMAKLGNLVAPRLAQSTNNDQDSGAK
jgi:integrase